MIESSQDRAQAVSLFPVPIRLEATVLQKIRYIVETQGVSGLASRSIAFAYRRGVRPWLPRLEPVRYAGIPIFDRRWGDSLVPASWTDQSEQLTDEPDYEATLIAGLNETIRPGDSVVVVGGGVGVTAVIAALRTGPSGTVQCFEGSRKHVSFVQQTATRNGVTNLTVRHAVVAKAIGVWTVGSDMGAVLPPSQLPPCDVLQLDCEGAEVEILRELTIQPRLILVETHGLYDAPTDLVASLLEKCGYIVSDRGVAEPSQAALCTEKDIRVLLGIKRQ